MLAFALRYHSCKLSTSATCSSIFTSSISIHFPISVGKHQLFKSPNRSLQTGRSTPPLSGNPQSSPHSNKHLTPNRIKSSFLPSVHSWPDHHSAALQKKTRPLGSCVIPISALVYPQTWFRRLPPVAESRFRHHHEAPGICIVENPARESTRSKLGPRVSYSGS